MLESIRKSLERYIDGSRIDRYPCFQEIIKKEEEKLRAFARKQAAQYRSRQRTREIGISSGFLEGYDSGKDVKHLRL